MADRSARPPLHRSRTSDGSIHEEHSRARQPASDRQRQTSTSGRTSSPEGPLFACPYSKHDPERYSHKNVEEQDYRNCSSGYWTSIPRLKQHLYRTHDRSQRCCPRCWLNFQNDDTLRKHVETMECQIRDMPEEKMDESMTARVRERIQGRPREAWYTIYHILFPEDDLPPSPLAEWVVGNDLRLVFEMLAQRLPALLFQAAVQREPSMANVQPTRNMVLPTTPDLIQRALLYCQREFGQQNDLTHVFENQSPTFPNINRGAAARALGALEQDEMGHQEAGLRGRQIAPRQRYASGQAPGSQAMYPATSAPYTSYYPGTPVPMTEAMYEAMNMREDMYEDYGMRDDEY